MQAAWPVIAERFPSLSEEEDLFVEHLEEVYVIQFLRLPADWVFSIIRLNDQGAARVRETLVRLTLLRHTIHQLPCWMDAMQAGLMRPPPE